LFLTKNSVKNIIGDYLSYVLVEIFKIHIGLRSKLNPIVLSVDFLLEFNASYLIKIINMLIALIPVCLIITVLIFELFSPSLRLRFRLRNLFFFLRFSLRKKLFKLRLIVLIPTNFLLGFDFLKISIIKRLFWNRRSLNYLGTKKGFILRFFFLRELKISISFLGLKEIGFSF